MSTLREAAQQALEALEATHYDVGSAEKQRLQVMDAITALRDALAQQEQEPVAWASKRELARIKDFDSTIYANGDFDGAVPLYTQPPRREWQGLTEEEVKDLAGEDDIFGAIVEFARAIEAKLKEKNNG